MPSPLPSPSYNVPSLGDLADLAVAASDALPVCGDWQRPGLRGLIDGIVALLSAPNPTDIPADLLDLDAELDRKLDDDVIGIMFEMAADPDGWADRYDDMRDGADFMDAQADRAVW